MTAAEFQQELLKYSSDSDAIFLQRFFKTGKGEYGEGDVFIGVRVPKTRLVCAQFRDLPISEIKELLKSPVHEHRLGACIIMSIQAKNADAGLHKRLFDLYMWGLDNGYINNWDIIDTTCDLIVGTYAYVNQPDLPLKLARQKNLWHKRSAMLMCFTWLKNNEVGPTLDVAEILKYDTHDLIQKAVGWLLRETGKRIDEAILTDYLEHHAHDMPRTQLRYAIEKLSTDQKKRYMGLKVQ